MHGDAKGVVKMEVRLEMMLEVKHGRIWGSKMEYGSLWWNLVIYGGL